jgi:hypothetical protein
MKHRTFQFLSGNVLPDNKLIIIASDSAFCLVVLTSKAHVAWATQAGGWLGVGNDPVYVKSRCFDPFPFPEATATSKAKIAALAEELDATRKLVLAENPDLTLTTLYNMREAIEKNASLSSKESDLCNRGRVHILKDLHEQIDQTVMQAYRWSETLTDSQIIERLVDLNRERVSEERRGLIRWLRADYQIEKLGPLAHRVDRVQSIASARPSRSQPSFPMEKKAQAGQVIELLSRSRSPLSADQIGFPLQGSKPDKVGNRRRPNIA